MDRTEFVNNKYHPISIHHYQGRHCMPIKMTFALDQGACSRPTLPPTYTSTDSPVGIASRRHAFAKNGRPGTTPIRDLCLCSLQCKPIRLRGYYDVTYCEFRGFHRVRVPKRSLLMASFATFGRQRLVLGIQRLSRNKRKLLPSF